MRLYEHIERRLVSREKTPLSLDPNLRYLEQSMLEAWQAGFEPLPEGQAPGNAGPPSRRAGACAVAVQSEPVNATEGRAAMCHSLIHRGDR